MQTQAPAQANNRYAEADNRDWRTRSVQPPPNNEDKSWDNIREIKASNRQQEQASKQDQSSSQFASKAQVCSI